MSFFRKSEGHDGDKGEVKTPRNQILQTPETQADKAKLENKRPGNSFWEDLRKDAPSYKDQAEYSKKLQNGDGSASGAPNKGQRERELGHTTDMER